MKHAYARLSPASKERPKGSSFIREKNRVSRKPEVSVCFDIRVYSIERKWGAMAFHLISLHEARTTQGSVQTDFAS